MKSQPVIHDWYCRIMLQSSLTELWLDKGDLAKSRTEANQLLEMTLSTTERTWQTLAWETNARVAMAEADLDQAQKCTANALSMADSFDIPLADWRAHATAAEVYARMGKSEASREHRKLSTAGILRLADSMQQDEPLRRIFLSASSVRRVLEPEKETNETATLLLTVRANEYEPQREIAGDRG